VEARLDFFDKELKSAIGSLGLGLVKAVLLAHTTLRAWELISQSPALSAQADRKGIPIVILPEFLLTDIGSHIARETDIILAYAQLRQSALSSEWLDWKLLDSSPMIGFDDIMTSTTQIMDHYEANQMSGIITHIFASLGMNIDECFCVS